MRWIDIHAVQQLSLIYTKHMSYMGVMYMNYIYYCNVLKMVGTRYCTFIIIDINDWRGNSVLNLITFDIKYISLSKEVRGFFLFVAYCKTHFCLEFD